MRHDRCSKASFVAVAVLLSSAASPLAAGPLNPPAGPVTSTGKTLTEVEPRIAVNATNTPGDNDATPSLFKISQPGSYYLTGNITGVIGKHGIEIAASGVTLDLNGFDLVGVPAMGAFDGVTTTFAELSNITVKNGSVRSWGRNGVTIGFNVGGRTSDNCAVMNCAVAENAADGVSLFNGGLVKDCRAWQNGDDGIFADSGSTVIGCFAQDNLGDGIDVSGGTTVNACSAFNNFAVGIRTNNGSTVTACTASNNSLDGILVLSGCTVTGCTTHFNQGNGISAVDGSMISGCSSYSSELDGILVGSSCSVLRNTCFNSGNFGSGAGVHATGSGNYIEGNNCTSATRGIDVDAAANVIIRNTCSGNTTNWSIAANNVVGPIIDRRAPASAAISGNSAPDSTGSTHPNANFTY